MQLNSIPSASARPRGLRRLALAVPAAMALGIGAVSAATGPFVPFDGSWAGRGTITMEDGTKERLRCQVQYLVQNDGNNLQQALRCESDTYKFQVNAYVDHNSGALTGNWQEVIYNVSGRVTGRVSGSRIQVDVDGGPFSASMVMIIRGRSQNVTIRVEGADVKEVSVDLTHGR